MRPGRGGVGVDAREAPEGVVSVRIRVHEHADDGGGDGTPSRVERRVVGRGFRTSRGRALRRRRRANRVRADEERYRRSRRRGDSGGGEGVRGAARGVGETRAIGILGGATLGRPRVRGRGRGPRGDLATRGRVAETSRGRRGGALVFVPTVDGDVNGDTPGDVNDSSPGDVNDPSPEDPPSRPPSLGRRTWRTWWTSLARRSAASPRDTSDTSGRADTTSPTRDDV